MGIGHLTTGRSGICRPSQSPAIAFRVNGTCHRKQKRSRPRDELQADFDLKDNPKLSTPEAVAATRAALIANPHVAAVFVGPSGEGLKAVVSINPDPSRHKDSWRAAELHFHDSYGLKLDPSTKDPMRLCFVSFDPEMETSEEFSPLPLPELSLLPCPTPAAQGLSISRDFPPTTAEEVAEMLSFIPPRPDYDTWLRVASAVWSVLPMLEGAQILNKWSPEEREGEYASKHKHRLEQSRNRHACSHGGRAWFQSQGGIPSEN